MREVVIPEVYKQLFVPTHVNGKKVRYRVSYSGRGAGKTWTYARVAILKAMEKKRRFLCCREFQNSIAESVHKVLADQIELLGFSDFFTITNTSIVARNGSEFVFIGLYANTTKLKSLEGIDICWCNEAEAMSKESLTILLPTIRKEDSEIWVEFNTRYVNDEIYDRFVVNQPDNCITIKTNWRDNPYFPEVLRIEKDQDFAYRAQDAQNIWEGMPIASGGLIWTDFKKGVHVKEFDMKEIKRNANFFMGMDPHSSYHPFCVWLALIPLGDGRFIKWIYDEYPKFSTFNAYYSDIRSKLHDTSTVADKAKQFFICDGTAEFGIKISKRALDSRFAKGAGAATSWSPISIVTEYAKPDNGGMSFQMPSEKIIDGQRDVIKKDMQYNHLMEIGTFNQPLFYVSSKCQNLIQSLMNHRFEEDSEREDSRWKDASDALRIVYALLATSRWEDPNPNKQYEQTHWQSRNTNVNSWMG